MVGDEARVPARRLHHGPAPPPPLPPHSHHRHHPAHPVARPSNHRAHLAHPAARPPPVCLRHHRRYHHAATTAPTLPPARPPRAGSSQNVSLTNVVLCTMWADSFCAIADQLETGAKPADVASKMLSDHWRVIFNGNGYSKEWPIEATKRGILQIPSGVEAIKRCGVV